LQRILPEIDALFGVPQRADYHPEIDTGDHVMRVIDMAASMQQPLAVRFAALTHDLGKALTPADVLPRHIGHEPVVKNPCWHCANGCGYRPSAATWHASPCSITPRFTAPLK
jgi:tRNA nucleotidyltransferase (CCA-adding enzyme)